MKNRSKQRENRKSKVKEEMLDKLNGYGVKDLTSYNAILKINTNGKSNIILA